MRYSKKFLFSVLGLSLLQIVGCAHPKNKSDERTTAYVKQVKSLETEVTTLREQNALLRTQADKKLNSRLPDTSKKVEEPDVNGEHSIYTSLLEAYWAKDLQKVRRFSAMLIKTYPLSVYADNSLYLESKILFENGQPAESIQILNRLLRSYPTSNKAVSAEYLKAEIFEKLNLKEQAQDLWLRISKQYPGSKEAKLSNLKLTVMKKSEKVLR